MMNMFQSPTGGEIMPISATINTRIPNQMAKCSGLMPKSMAVTIGKKIGNGQHDHGERVHDAAEDDVEHQK